MKPNRGLLVGVVIILVSGMFFITGSGTAYFQNGLSIFLPLVLNNYPKPIDFTPTPTATLSPTIKPNPTSIIIFTAGPLAIDPIDDIYKINTDGTELVNLTNASGLYGYLTWSPDGSRFSYFYQGLQGRPGIYIMNADGSDRTYLVYGDEPSWSPDGSMIAFAEYDWYMGYDKLSIINSDGSGLRELVSFNDGPVYGPAWSPKGDRIAFSWSNNDPPYNNEIFIVNSDGSGLTNLTSGQGGYEPLKWSPDGSQIVFGFDGDIYVMNADGTERTNITNSPLLYEGLDSWSPDGKKISYDCDNQICVMNPDGSGKIIITDEKGIYSSSTWSPNSSQLAFIKSHYYPTDPIFIVNSDGTGMTLLTDLPSSTVKGQPAWQP